MGTEHKLNVCEAFRGCPEHPCQSVLSIKLHAFLHWSSVCALNISSTFNLHSVSRGRFYSYSKSEVFVRIAVLIIQTILRSISTVKSFTENADYQTIFTEAELQSRIFLEISEIILFVTVTFRHPLYPNFAT